MPEGNARPRTEDTGHFRLIDLSPGTYYLAALPGAFASDGASHPLPPAFFPGSADPTAAQPVSLDMGMSRTDIVVALKPGPTFRVTGRVLDTAGQPADRRGLRLLQTHEGDVASLLGVQGETRPDGTFEFAGVPVGTYVLQSTTDPPRHEFASKELQVVETDVNDIELRMSAGVAARGHITFEGEAPLPTADDIQLVAEPVEFITSPAISFAPLPVFIAPDWSFEMLNLSGLRVLTSRTVPRGQWMLKSVTLNGFDVADVPLDFRKGPIDNLEVIFTSRVTRVSGSMVDEKGELVKDCTVVVFAADRARWTFPSRYTSIARSTQQGRFTVIGLPPEDYLAVALPGVDGREWPNPAFLERLRPIATSFTLSEGEAKTISLTLRKRP